MVRNERGFARAPAPGKGGARGRAIAWAARGAEGEVDGALGGRVRARGRPCRGREEAEWRA